MRQIYGKIYITLVQIVAGVAKMCLRFPASRTPGGKPCPEIGLDFCTVG